MSALLPYISIQLQGEQRLADDLSLLEDDIQRKYCRVALKEGSAPIVAAEKASTAFEDDTGLLRGSIKPYFGRGDRPGRTSVLIGAVTTVGQFLSALRDNEAAKATLKRRLIYKYLGNINAQYLTWYARAVEFGHEPSGWYAKQANAVPVPEHSFARSSFDATVDTAADITIESLADQIESA
jgi:hypothetical protein